MIDELDDASENGSSTATATKASKKVISGPCLLYTSDAADE